MTVSSDIQTDIQTNTQTRLSLDAYRASSDYAAHDAIQLIDGEMVITMPPLSQHQFIVVEIVFLLRLYAQTHGGRVGTAPFEVALDDANAFQPDAFYLAPQSQATVTREGIAGAPELVIEVLSPSSIKHDRETKFRVYEEQGVREYWIVDPHHQSIEVYSRTQAAAERFSLQGAYVPGESFTSTVLPETQIDVAAVFNNS